MWSLEIWGDGNAGIPLTPDTHSTVQGRSGSKMDSVGMSPAWGLHAQQKIGSARGIAKYAQLWIEWYPRTYTPNDSCASRAMRKMT